MLSAVVVSAVKGGAFLTQVPKFKLDFGWELEGSDGDSWSPMLDAKKGL